MKAQRYVGIDLGKRTYEMSIIGTNGKVKASNGKTTAEGRQALYGRLLPSDLVAMEVCSLAIVMAREIEDKAGCRVILLNPSQIALIYRSVKKNDKEDALKLARLIQRFPEDELPKVELPTEQEEKIRQILTELRQLKNDRTREVNRLHAVFLEFGVTDMRKKNLDSDENREDAVKSLDGDFLAEARRIMRRLSVIEEQIGEVDANLDKAIKDDGDIEKLMEIPGVGRQLAAAFKAHIGDGSRYPNASTVGAAVGLVPRIDFSGDVKRLGHITKRGNGNLRSLLILGAWSHVRSKDGGAVKDKFLYMTSVQSKGKKVAIVAAARKLAEMMYTILKTGSSYEKRTLPIVKELAEKALAS